MTEKTLVIGAVIKCMPCASRRELINVGVVFMQPATGGVHLEFSEEPPRALALIDPGVHGYYRQLRDSLYTQCSFLQAQLPHITTDERATIFHNMICPREQRLQYSSLISAFTGLELSSFTLSYFRQYVSP